MEEKICSFAGHAQIYGDYNISTKIKNKIINLIENYGVTTFYNGYKGTFDVLCASCVKDIKNDYPHIKSYMILSYMPVEKTEYEVNLYKDFDDIIYPDLEYVPKRFAIVKRNEWMVDKSDFLIVYVEHDWGGAYRTLEYAKKKKHIKVINLCNSNI